MRTHDGGLLRGTLIESVPGERARIRLSTGEVRVVPWAQVEYAGPDSRPGPLPPPPATDSPPSRAVYGVPPLTLRLVGAPSAVSFHEITESHGTVVLPGILSGERTYDFRRLCQAPCEIPIEPGSHRFALSLGRGEEVLAPALDIWRSGTLTGTYLDRSGFRIAGWTLIIGAPLAAVGLATLAASLPEGAREATIGLAVTAGLSMLVGEILGLIFALQPDGAMVRFN